MSYGYMLKNNRGWSIVDDQSEVYYPSLSGTSLQAPSNKYFGGVMWRQFAEITVFSESVVYVATNNFHNMPGTGYLNPNNYIEPGYISADRDICFWQLNSGGLCWMSQFIVPRTLVSRRKVGNSWGSLTRRANKTHYAVSNTRALNPKFFILSVDDIPANLPGSYGLQIRNENGSVAVDSRKPLASIDHVHFVQASVFDNVLNNNAVVNITLPFAIPSCYVHAPMWKSFKRISQYINDQTDIYFPRISQTSPTNLRIDRVKLEVDALEGDLPTTSAGQPGSHPFWGNDFYFDCPLFISRGYPL